MSGVSPEASWIVGAINDNVTAAKLSIVKSNVKKKSAANTLDGLSDAPPGYVTARPGYCGLAIPPSEGSSFGIFVRVPAGTEVKVTVDGRMYADTALASTLLIQDGVIKAGQLRSLSHFLMTMQFPALPAQPEFTKRNGFLFISPSLAHDHLLTFSKPAPVAAGCCGNQIMVRLDIVIDETGNVLNVKRIAGLGANVGPLESLIAAWKFVPFQYQGMASRVRLQFPVVFADNSVASPIF